jgi:MOSC domain-containing protein YiiM
VPQGIDGVGQVVRLFIAVIHRQPMREVGEVAAVVNRGLEGCIHGRPGSRRQVLLMDAETLELLGVPPGAVKENITTSGLRVGELQAGQRLRVGEALFEVSVPCEPCHRMDEIRQGLKEKLLGRRGMLCRVVEAGRICRGDGIQVLDGVNAAN